MQRFFYGGRMTRIPDGSKIKVLKFLPMGRAIIEHNGERVYTFARFCWKRKR